MPMVPLSVRCDRAVDYEGSLLWSDVFKSVTFSAAENVQLLWLYPVHDHTYACTYSFVTKIIYHILNFAWGSSVE